MAAKRVGPKKKKAKKFPSATEADRVLARTEALEDRPMLKDRPYVYSDGTTQSLLGTWLDCRKRARLYLDGYRMKKTSVPLEWGSMMHFLFEHVYKMTIAGEVASYKDAIEAFEPLLQRYIETWQAHVTESSLAPQEMELLAAMADGVWPQYCKHWADDFKKVKWMELEGVFDEAWEPEDCSGPHRLRGMRDGVIDRKDGLWWLETKTKGQISEGMLERTLGFNFQNLFYILAGELAAKRIGSKKRVQGVLYNIVRRPQIKPDKKTNDLKAYVERLREDTQTRPNFYYMRMELTYPDSVRKQFRADLSAILQEFRSWLDGGMPTYMQRFACEGRKFNCAYIDACNKRHMRGYLRDGRLFNELEV